MTRKYETVIRHATHETVDEHATLLGAIDYAVSSRHQLKYPNSKVSYPLPEIRIREVNPYGTIISEYSISEAIDTQIYYGDGISWAFDDGVEVRMEEFDYSLKTFSVFRGSQCCTIFPYDIGHMMDCMALMTLGINPVTDGWSDGQGESVEALLLASEGSNEDC